MQKSKSRSRARSNRKGGTFFGLERLESRELLALAPQLLKDIGFGDSSNPSGVIQVGDNRYFSADDGVHGQELWKTDGTPAGTTMVKDIRPGAANLDVRSMASFAGALYFTAGGGTHVELWKSDGTAQGTVFVTNIGASPSFSFYVHLAAIGGTLFMIAEDSDHGQELWKSDGTAAGTMLLKDINPGPRSSFPSDLTDVDGTLFFRARTDTEGYELWRSDGTAAGTVPVKDIAPGPSDSLPTSLVKIDGVVFFNANDGVHGNELWKSDGTADGTVLVKDIKPGSAHGVNFLLATQLNGMLYFTADDGVHGEELWRSDGTESGTVLFNDIRTGTAGSGPGYFTADDQRFIFWANDGVSGLDPWISDGSASGTRLIEDVESDSLNRGPRDQLLVNGVLYFTLVDVEQNSATTDDWSAELWRSDGTPSGTEPIAQFKTYENALLPSTFSQIDHQLFFSAYDREHGKELWVTDGSVDGTGLFKDINVQSTTPSSPWAFATVGDEAFFSAMHPVTGFEVWRTDGTTAGTRPVGDLFPDNLSSVSSPQYLSDGTFVFSIPRGSAVDFWKSDGTQSGTRLIKSFEGGYGPFLTEFNGTYLFAGHSPAQGFELWKTDLTPEGTVLVMDIFPGTNGSSPGMFTNVNGTMFFTAESQSTEREIWKTDGTPEGTVRVKEFGGSTSSLYPHGLMNVNGLLCFSGVEGLWRSDGTGAGTFLIKNVNGFGPRSRATPLKVGNVVYFQGGEASHGWELWKTDGTAAGTVMVKDIRAAGSQHDGSSDPGIFAASGDTLYFSADDGINGRELWKTNGTAASTTLIDIVPGFRSSAPEFVAKVGDAIYFTATDQTHGRELWKTNGPLGGATLVKDIRRGIADGLSTVVWPSPHVVGDLLFFIADDGVHGFELWRTDGTALGTQLVADLNAGPANSYPSGFADFQGALLFSADDGVHGQEPWILPNASGPFGDLTTSTPIGPRVAVPGQLVSYQVSFLTPNAAANVSATVDWGDGRIEPAYVSILPSTNQAIGVASFWHTYLTWGNYNIRLTLQGSTVKATTVGVPLAVATITYQPDPLDSTKTALVVGGLAGVNDQLLFEPAAGGVRHTYNGHLAGTFTFDGSIVAYGQSGSDAIRVDRAIVKPAILFGQDGDDHLVGGGGADLLVGGAGNDSVFGFGARDLLFGGLGADAINGAGFGPPATPDESDLLCADFWSFEGDPMALRSAYRRWQTPTTYAARLTNLRYGAVPLMNSATIFNDFSGDALVGGDDDDWFVTVGFDSIVDAQEHEEGLGAPIGRRLRSN